ncbi:MAG: hypothetical protein VBE63_14410 [Lamprobacter sp.]|nr:hypothetical protein [Lamprobacter sp.]MEA3641117.1 hypothetical protein [Lamprobacter sp.]
MIFTAPLFMLLIKAWRGAEAVITGASSQVVDLVPTGRRSPINHRRP